jgi:hypothetical protein
MTKRGDPKLFQVLVCQMRQDTKIDDILGKALRVLPETELLKSVTDLLHRGSAPRLSGVVRPHRRVYPKWVQRWNRSRDQKNAKAVETAPGRLVIG